MKGAYTTTNTGRYDFGPELARLEFAGMMVGD